MAILTHFGYRAFHFTYFLATCMISSVIFYLLSSAPRTPSYVDSLFMCVSAMTGTGLTTISEAELGVFQQIILFGLLLIGHAIPVSAVTLFFRKRACREKLKLFADINNKLAVPNFSPGSDIVTNSHLSDWVEKPGFDVKIESNECKLHSPSSAPAPANSRVSPQVGNLQAVVATMRQTLLRVRGILRAFKRFLKSKFGSDVDHPTSVEYRALSLLIIVVSLYWITILLIGIIGMGSWLRWRRADVARADGLPPFWAGAFTATSAFVNCGMSLFDEDLVPIQSEAFPLCFLGILILAGYTLYPCLLRGILRAMRDLIPKDSERWQHSKDALDYILAYPQSVYHMLFPTSHTFFLLGCVVVLNGINWIAFGILATRARDNKAIRILDGLFQSLAIRGGGFEVVNFSNLPQSILVLYALMMYISPFPVQIAARNILKIQGAIFSDKPPKVATSNQLAHKTRSYRQRLSKLTHATFLCEQIRSQISKDVMCIATAVFLVTILESEKYDTQPVSFSTFNIMFEVVSAYSCIGISVGFPGQAHSFCGELRPGSKLILSAMSFIGRHNGLPMTEFEGLETCQSLDLDQSARKAKNEKICQIDSVNRNNDIV